MGGVLRGALIGVALVALAGCAMLNPPLEQRTSHGPSAEELFIYRSMLLNGREPSFDERRYWDDQLDLKVSQYLRQHPDVANSLDVSTFRFYRRPSIGMSKEQVLILLGAPEGVTTDAGEMEKLARRYWAGIKGNATEVWMYPLGWSFFFAGPKVVDITQYLER
jgi:hypothetical protein